MQDEVLILPEGSPNFMRTVRLSTLYSEKLHVYLPTNQTAIDELSIFLALSAPARAFVQLSIAHRDEIDMLRKADLLTSITDDLLENISKLSDSLSELLNHFEGAKNLGEEFRGVSPIPVSYLNQATKGQFAVCHVLDMLLDFALTIYKSKSSLSAEMEKLTHRGDFRDRVVLGAYFVLSSYYALQRGCVCVTWDEGTREVFQRVCGIWAGESESEIEIESARSATKNQFGEYILQEEVPDVSQLNVADILEIRIKRDGELKHFRDALRQFTSEIDPKLSDTERRLAFDDIRDRFVRPALNELNASIRALKIQTSNDQLSASLQESVTFGLTLTAGYLSGDILPAAGLSLVGLLCKKIYDGTYGLESQEKQLVTKSPWGVCFDLNSEIAKKVR